MKISIKKCIAWVCTILLVVSCGDDFENKLEGKWQLQKVEANGQVHQVDTVWYNFQTSLFMYQIYIPATDSFRYTYGYRTFEKDNQLLLELNSYAQPVEKFLPFTDWTSATRLFTIDKCTTKQLILSSEGKQYIFRKF